MPYMVHWTIAPEHHESAGKAFLEHGAPVPEGLTMIGRWHAPGSHNGWLICDGDAGALAEHLSFWGSRLNFTVTPVVSDDIAGAAHAKTYG